MPGPPNLAGGTCGGKGETPEKKKTNEKSSNNKKKEERERDVCAGSLPGAREESPRGEGD